MRSCTGRYDSQPESGKVNDLQADVEANVECSVADVWSCGSVVKPDIVADVERDVEALSISLADVWSCGSVGIVREVRVGGRREMLA